MGIWPDDLGYVVTKDGYVVPKESVGRLIVDETLWRVGSHYDIHIYNALGVPIATAMTAEAAKQIVEEHNEKWKTEVNVISDKRPHSRACGIRLHPHGRLCARDCPTCGGTLEEQEKRCEVHGVFHVFGLNCR